MRSSAMSFSNWSKIERLRAVGKRVLGIVVDFEQQAIGARGDRGARHGRNFVAKSRCRATGRPQSADAKVS